MYRGYRLWLVENRTCLTYNFKRFTPSGGHSRNVTLFDTCLSSSHQVIIFFVFLLLLLCQLGLGNKKERLYWTQCHRAMPSDPIINLPFQSSPPPAIPVPPSAPSCSSHFTLDLQHKISNCCWYLRLHHPSSYCLQYTRVILMLDL